MAILIARQNSYAQIDYTPALPHHSDIRPCHQLFRSLDMCRHPEFIAFWLSRTASWMYATCSMILEEPWAMRSPQNLDDLQMHLIECCGSIIVGTLRRGTLSL